MQKQDKALYSQLLSLQESIRGLKNELKKEREECEEAFKDLEEMSGTEFEDDVFHEGSEETSSEKNGNAFNTQETWKHDRQDSGISVKTPEAESQESLVSTSKHHTHETDFLKSCTSSQASKPELISHSKQDLNPHFKTMNVELPQKKTSNAKPVVIQHSKQDSGILIDEEAIRDTTLLSKLVESSEMLEKLENRKFDRIIQKEWLKVRANSSGNRGKMIQHQRSRSSNDLLKWQPHESLPHQFSTPNFRPIHYRNNSGQGTEINVEKQSFRQLKERGHLSPNHSRTSSCPQTVLKQFTAQKDLQTFEKPSIKRPSELGKVERFKTDDKQQSKLPNAFDLPLNTNEKLEISWKVDSPKENHSFTPNDRAALSLALNSGSRSPTSKSVFKQNFIPNHQHTRSLPATPVRELIVAENLLSRQDNRQSMQDISVCKAVTSKQLRPRKRSASFVDLNSLADKTGTAQSGTFSPRKTNVIKDDTLQHGKENGLLQGNVNLKPRENSFNTQKANVIQNGSVKQTKENDLSQLNDNSSSRTPRKANVVQVDSFSTFNQTGKSIDDTTQSNESKRDRISTSHKASVVRTNSVPQDNILTPNKARVVHINNLKQSQENITQNQANQNGELKALKPLRAVLVSATEVNVSNIAEKQSLTRRCSLDERGTGNYRPSDGPQRRFTITNCKTDRLSPRPLVENGELSSRFLAPKNHLRHHTMPEYDVIRRRHSLFAFHASSKSWDGYASRKPKEFNGLVRSASQVSFV